MGQAGKIGIVLRALGSPIIGQTDGASFLDTEGRDDGPSGSVLRDIPMMDMEGVARPEGSEWGEAAEPISSSTRTVGYHFDGLSRSMHLEIIYKEEEAELSVYHRGFLVYQEAQGELSCYVPIKEWEDWISSLHKASKRIQRESKENEFKDRVQKATESKNSWIRYIQSRWGIT
jgi:hypothetical protein